MLDERASEVRNEARVDGPGEIMPTQLSGKEDCEEAATAFAGIERAGRHVRHLSRAHPQNSVAAKREGATVASPLAIARSSAVRKVACSVGSSSSSVYV